MMLATFLGAQLWLLAVLAPARSVAVSTHLSALHLLASTAPGTRCLALPRAPAISFSRLCCGLGSSSCCSSHVRAVAILGRGVSCLSWSASRDWPLVVCLSRSATRIGLAPGVGLALGWLLTAGSLLDPLGVASASGCERGSARVSRLASQLPHSLVAATPSIAAATSAVPLRPRRGWCLLVAVPPSDAASAGASIAAAPFVAAAVAPPYPPDRFRLVAVAGLSRWTGVIASRRTSPRLSCLSIAEYLVRVGRGCDPPPPARCVGRSLARPAAWVWFGHASLASPRPSPRLGA